MYTGTDAIYKAFPVYRCSRGHDYLPEILYVLRCHGHSLAGIIIDYEPTARDEILERMIPACLATDGAGAPGRATISGGSGTTSITSGGRHLPSSLNSCPHAVAATPPSPLAQVVTTPTPGLWRSWHTRRRL